MPKENTTVYTTNLGKQLCGDSRKLLAELPEESVDLIVTSPPFALLRKKKYGNREQAEYVAWLHEFGQAAYPALKPTGSFVIDLGGAYVKGHPVRSLYNFRVLIDFVDTIGYFLAEDFYWHNPAKLPSPIEWVNKAKERVKDSVNTIWWFSKSERPKADVRKVYAPYSDRMKKLLEDPAKFFSAAKRPSGHDITLKFGDRENKGAIPPNLLQIPNTDSNSHYMRTCKALERERHPARFPPDVPRFFIEFLTDPGDLIVDIFSGSNTTGYVAEGLERRWIGMELSWSYAALSAIRFMEDKSVEDIAAFVKEMEEGKTVKLKPDIVLPETRLNGEPSPKKARPARKRRKKGKSMPLFD